MPSDADQDGQRKRSAAAGVLLIAILCCALPLLVTVGGLNLVGGILGQAWLIGPAGLIAIGAIWWAVRRRANLTEGDGCCAPEPLAGTPIDPARASTSHLREG